MVSCFESFPYGFAVGDVVDVDVSICILIDQRLSQLLDIIPGNATLSFRVVVGGHENVAIVMIQVEIGPLSGRMLVVRVTAPVAPSSLISIIEF